MPVIMFAVVFGLSMDYEVFLISRVREQWIRHGDASAAVGDGLALTGRVITAAAAIMVCVFLSFTLGDERMLKEFGFGLAVAVFLDALVVRCVLLPAVLELLGPVTWRLPRWLDARLPHINIEAARNAPLPKAEPSTTTPPSQEEIAGTRTLFVCDVDDGGAPIHPCRRVQEALRAADIHYEKVVTGHCVPSHFCARIARTTARRDRRNKTTGAQAPRRDDRHALPRRFSRGSKHRPGTRRTLHAGRAGDLAADDRPLLPTPLTATRTPDQTQPN